MPSLLCCAPSVTDTAEMQVEYEMCQYTLQPNEKTMFRYVWNTDNWGVFVRGRLGSPPLDARGAS
ncbi:hypothetical protein N9L68_05210 [bacterium]|nr:hypothetical protein [bacterium]